MHDRRSAHPPLPPAPRPSPGALRETLAGTFRHAARRLRRAPGLTLAVVLSYALGIGANATMFEVVDRLLLSPPAHVADPEGVRRLAVDRLVPETGARQTSDVVSFPDFEDFQQARGLAAVAAVGYRTLAFGRGAEAREADAALVSGAFFSVLGARPALGRFFGPADDRPEAPGVAVLSHGAWRRDHGGDPAVVGKTLDFGYGPYTIVGVAPEGFTGMDVRPVSVWLPLRPAATQMQGTLWATSRGLNMFRVVARVAPGTSPAAAEAEATELHRRGRGELVAAGRYDPEARVVAAPLIAARGPLATTESRVVRWLAGLSLLVLLIACANVANLLLARALRQRREIGIQLALGGSRRRVLGQVLAESLLLAALGGAAALVVAWLGGDAVRTFLLPEVAWPERAVGTRVLGFVAALALLSGAAAGAVPAFQASRVGVAETLKAGGARASHGSRARGALVVLQVALSVVLLVAAGSFVRSLHRVSTLDLGLDPAGVLFVDPVMAQGTSKEREAAFLRDATARLKRLPGVEAASADLSVPFWSAISVELRVPGLDSVPTLPTGGPVLHAVDEGYFDVLRMRIVRGRGLRPDDNRPGATPVAVVNETMARVLWPRGEALGRCLIIKDDPGEPVEPPCATVVGVVENARSSSLVEGETMQYYFPIEQGIVGWAAAGVLVRVRGDERAMIPVVQRALLEVDPAVRFPKVQPLSQLAAPEMRPWRLGAAVFTAFGLLALAVAGVGLYSVLAFSVAQRTFELGIRAALGATGGRLRGMVLWQSLRIVGVSLAIGLAAAVAAAPRLEPLLYQVSPRDPVILASVCLALLVVGLLAATVPARRATSVDPSAAFRAE